MKYFPTTMLALAVLLTVAPASVFAEDGVRVNASTSVHVEGNRGPGPMNFGDKLRGLFGGEGKMMPMPGDRDEKPHDKASSTPPRGEFTGEKARAYGDASIDVRIKNLTNAIDRIAKAERLSDDAKASLTASLQAQITSLTNLKAEIATGATTTLKDDIGSITKSYRVYALVLPKAAITAMADRVMTVTGQMEALATKLDARIDAARDAGADVSASESAYADFTAKITDAKVQAQAAVDLVEDLSADEGDKTKFDANVSALKEAKAKLDAAQADLKTARADIGTILKGVKGKGEVRGDASVEVSS